MRRDPFGSSISECDVGSLEVLGALAGRPFARGVGHLSLPGSCGGSRGHTLLTGISRSSTVSHICLVVNVPRYSLCLAPLAELWRILLVPACPRRWLSRFEQWRISRPEPPEWDNVTLLPSVHHPFQASTFCSFATTLPLRTLDGLLRFGVVDDIDLARLWRDHDSAVVLRVRR